MIADAAYESMVKGLSAFNLDQPVWWFIFGGLCVVIGIVVTLLFMLAFCYKMPNLRTCSLCGLPLFKWMKAKEHSQTQRMFCAKCQPNV